MTEEDEKEKMLNAISWYFDLDLNAAKDKMRRLNYTQRQDILWSFEDHLMSHGEYDFG